MGKPLTSTRKFNWCAQRRRPQAGIISLQSLARLAGLDLDEILDRIRHGHIAPVFTRDEALGLMLLLRRERSLRIFGFHDDDDRGDHD